MKQSNRSLETRRPRMTTAFDGFGNKRPGHSGLRLGEKIARGLSRQKSLPICNRSPCFFSLALAPCISVDSDHGWTFLINRGAASRPRYLLGTRCSAVLPSHLGPHLDGRFRNVKPDWAVNLGQPRHHALHFHLVLIYTQAIVRPRPTTNLTGHRSPGDGIYPPSIGALTGTRNSIITKRQR